MEHFPSIKSVSVDSLTPYARNARTHTEEQVAQIAASFREFGWTNPILIDGERRIIAGHGRLLAARKLGMAEVPVIELQGLTEAQKRAYIIADNQIPQNSGWDLDLLSAEVKGLKGFDVDLSVLGFSEETLRSLLSPEVQEPETLADEDDVPELEDRHVSAEGDTWILGEHRVACGDCLSESTVQALMGNDLADMVWTDPPYNVAVEGAAGKILNDDMKKDDFRQFLHDVYAQYAAFSKPGATIYVAHSESERAAFTEELEKAGFYVAQTLIWVKDSAVLSRQDFNWQHEPILYGWKEGQGHYFCKDFTLTTVLDDERPIRSMSKQELIRIAESFRKNQPTTVLRHHRPKKSDLHPTMKPVSLVQRMIEWSSQAGDIVIDFFGGSGTTLIATHKTGRKARITEMDPRFCDVIVKRWQDYTGKDAILESTGETFNARLAAISANT